MADIIETEEFLLYGSLLLTLGVTYCALKRKHNRKRKSPDVWVRDWVAKRKTLGLHATLLKELADPDNMAFANYMHMDEATFLYILSKVGPKISKNSTNYREPISAEDRLLATLRFLATGERYSKLQYSTRIPKCTLSKLIRETCRALYVTLREEHLKVPKTEEEWLRIAEEYHNQWQSVNTIGCLGGKHIRFHSPCQSGSHFSNDKGCNSIIFMALTDANYKFIMIDVGTHGQVGDTGVFAKSKIKECMLNKSLLNIPYEGKLPGTQTSTPFVALADDTFPLSHTIMKPYPRQGIQTDEKIFNYRHSRARRMVESSFGILATRFRVLLTTIGLPPETVTDLTLACCALHNLLVEKCKASYTRMQHNRFIVNGGSYVECQSSERHEDMAPLATQVDQGFARQGKEIRDKLKTYYNTIGAVPWQNKKIN